jgi:Uncharacterised nucleotidyltransferase
VPSPLTESIGAPEGDPRSLAARNLLLTSELLTIARGLDAAGVAFIVLKGVPLAYRIFGRLEARRIRDNDILVHPGDVDRALGVLRDFGYEPLHPALPPGKEFRRTNQYAMLHRLPTGAVAHAELHRTAFYPAFFAVPEQIEWGHTQPFRLHGVTVRVFDEPLTLLHLAAHFAQHACSQAWILRDVAAAWNTWHRDVDRDELLRLARDTGTGRVLEFALRAAQELDLLLAPAPLTASRRVAVLRRLLPTRRLFEPRPDPDHRRNLLVFLLTGPRLAPRYLVHGMFPTIERMSVVYGRPVSGRLYLRYATRPFRALRRALSKRPP